LQSVNVLRNINYLALCVKTEVQRAGHGSSSRQRRQDIATCGMQLLVALLPHTDQAWRANALMGENCSAAASLLYGRRRGEAAVMQEGIADAQKRLWILFRMVHLSSAVPEEVQGQLSALVEKYLRPVLVERRVPLGYRPALKLPGPGGSNAEDVLAAQGGLTKGSARGNAKYERQGSGDSINIGGKPPSVPEEVDRKSNPRSSFGEEDGRSQYAESSCAGDSLSSAAPRDMGQVLRKLVATRQDVVNVLGRLPATALLGPAQSPQSDSVLEDMFKSIVCAVKLPGSGASTVGVATGFNFCDASYRCDNMDVAVMVQVCVPKEDVNGGVDEVSIQLTSILDEEPDGRILVSAWTAMTTSTPALHNEATLKIRRRTLKRAKDVLRSMARRAASTS